MTSRAISTAPSRSAETVKQGAKALKRMNTRARLLDAARAAFLQRDYFSVTVDDIARQAGVSRAGFYLHFENREDILHYVMSDASRSLDILYHRLAGGEVDFVTARRFVSRFFVVYARAPAWVRLVQIAQAHNAGFLMRLDEHRMRHFQILGRHVPAFRDLDDPAHLRRLTRAKILFYSLEKVALQLVFAPGVISREYAIELLAGEFLRFVKSTDADQA